MESERRPVISPVPLCQEILVNKDMLNSDEAWGRWGGGSEVSALPWMGGNLIPYNS